MYRDCLPSRASTHLSIPEGRAIFTVRQHRPSRTEHLPTRTEVKTMSDKNFIVHWKLATQFPDWANWTLNAVPLDATGQYDPSLVRLQ